MNRDDYKMGTDPSLDGAFVRAYDHAPDWSWILLERVQVIQDDESFVKLFPNDVLPSMDEIRNSSRVSRSTSAFPERFHIDTIHDFLQENPAHLIMSWAPAKRILLEIMRIRNPDLVEVSDDLILAILTSYNRSPAFRAMRKAVIKYGVDVKEALPGNVGVTPNGDVILIDSSVSRGNSPPI
jgi:hypothetical protein